MEKISCSVDNCSHCKNGACYADRVEIKGSASQSQEHTVCSSFLESSVYGELTNNVNSNGPCSCLECKVGTCAHNSDNLCTLNSISVCTDSNRANLYTETSCQNFECR